MPTRVRVSIYAPGVVEVQGRATGYARDLAEEVARDARLYVPVLTGMLRSTIRTEPIPHGGRVWAGNVMEGIDYHLYQEYGTSVMPAQPYLRPAAYKWRGA